MITNLRMELFEALVCCHLSLVSVPPPQLTEQPPHGPQAPHPPATGQAWPPHARVSSASPAHAAPPLLGRGAVQLRARAWEPPPQVALQPPHGPQPLQPPSTAGQQR